MTRLAVTGMGIETSLGTEIDDFWFALSQGISGISPIEAFDTLDFPCTYAGQVAGDSTRLLSSVEARRTARVTHLLYSSVFSALGGEELPVSRDRVALVVGTAGGGMSHLVAQIRNMPGPLATRDWQAFERLSVLKAMPNMAAGFVAQKLGIEGPCLTITTSCAASLDAIGLARSLLLSDQVDLAIVAGTEAWIDRWTLGSFCKLQALSTRPPDEASVASRPFDDARDGMVPAEGAGALLLEREEDALDRSAKPHGFVLGSASTCDAAHPVMPRPDGAVAARAVTRALAAASVQPDDIDLVIAHGTSTVHNDVTETKALHVAFGDRAPLVPVTAPKSVLGHTLGASGVIETIGGLLSLKHQFIPPTINLERPDPACDLDYTPNIGRSAELRLAVKCSFGFGGHNSAVVLGGA